MVDAEVPAEIEEPLLALKAGMDAADHLADTHTLGHRGGHHVGGVRGGHRQKQVALADIGVGEIRNAGAIAMNHLGVEVGVELISQPLVLLDERDPVRLVGERSRQMPADLPGSYDNDVHGLKSGRDRGSK